MYEEFYGFNEAPFNVTPDTKFFFPSKKHEEALAALRYTVQYRKGFAAITGNTGTGKTTVCRMLLKNSTAMSRAP